MLRALIDRCGPLPSDTTIVDSDPGKGRLRGLPVVRPEEARAALRSSALLVICTHHHAEAILANASELAEDPTLGQRTVVIGALGPR